MTTPKLPAFLREFSSALSVATAFGLVLRFYLFAVHPPTLWQDEAYWAVRSLNMQAIDAQIRPLGFMLLTQGLLRVLGAAAWVYRLMPFLASLLSMALAPYVAERLFERRWTQLLAVLLLATNPVLLEMSAEFKHYGTEIGAYVAVLAAWLSFKERGTLRSFALLLGTAWFSFFFSITIIFSYPALFATLAWQAFRSKQLRRLIAIGATALVCLGTITTIYFTTWRTISAHKAENKWGTWYDVFYLKNGLKTQYDSRLAWTTAKYVDLAAVPGVDRQLWKSERLEETSLERLRKADWVLWGALHLAGLAWLARRRSFEKLALLWSPLLLLMLFNLLGRWPAGAFRSNAFYVPFAILLASFGAEWLPARARLSVLGFGLAGALWLSALVFRPHLLRKELWTKTGFITEAMMLLPPKPPRDQRVLVMDFESCRPWDYYTQYDRPFAERGARLRRNYQEKCLRSGAKLSAEMRRLVRSQPDGFTFLLTDFRKFDGLEETVKQTCAQSTLKYVHDRTHLIITCKGER